MFVNDKKTGDRDPDTTGKITHPTAGELGIVGWKNQSKSGDPYTKIGVRKFQPPTLRVVRRPSVRLLRKRARCRSNSSGSRRETDRMMRSHSDGETFSVPEASVIRARLSMHDMPITKCRGASLDASLARVQRDGHEVRRSKCGPSLQQTPSSATHGGDEMEYFREMTGDRATGKTKAMELWFKSPAYRGNEQ